MEEVYIGDVIDSLEAKRERETKELATLRKEVELLRKVRDAVEGGSPERPDRVNRPLSHVAVIDALDAYDREVGG
jgi:hypothetical protein